jgi:hypothetical protein
MGLDRNCKPPVRVHGFRRCALALFTVLLVTACQSKTPPDQRVARFVDEVMFGGPIDSHLPKEDRVVKWGGDPLVAVTGTDVGEYRSRVSAQLERFSELSGLDARIGDAAIPADLKITFVESEDFLINREHVPCFARIRTRFDRIVVAEVHLSTARPDQIDHCLSHELLHAFGLRYHSGIVRSALSPAHEAAQLTPWDELALRVLYDAKLELGAARADAAPIIQEVVSELITGP